MADYTSVFRPCAKRQLLLPFITALLVAAIFQQAAADNFVNFTDFSALAAKWQQSGCASADNWCSGVDYDISGTVDVNDLMLFSEDWLDSKEPLLSDDIASLIIYLNPTKTWTYDRAFMVRSLYEKWKACHNPAYLAWVKNWLDPQIASDGTITGYKQSDYNLDMIQPGRLLLAMYRHFSTQKYKLAADKLLVQLVNQPTTFDGGFWHKLIYPRQMWLDGVYMAEPFAAEYAQMFNAPQWADEAAFQITLIASHTQDKLIYPSDPTRTGLMYHGWDGSAFETPPLTPKVWADPVYGHSPEFWGRAMGWYAMAIVDCLDYLPADHPQRGSIISIFNTLAGGLAAYQDPPTGLWWQIVNKGYPRETYPENYTESSCSGMFSYAIGKAVDKGYITSDPNFYRTVSLAGFEGLRDYKVSYNSSGRLVLKDTVQVGSLNTTGDYAYYMSIARPDNDIKGVGALMLAALQYEKTPKPADVTPPAPDPMSWASAPTGTGPDTVTMTALAASDSSGVEYYFANLTASSHDSGWQNSPVFIDAGLAAGQTYTYVVKARDKSPAHNETQWSQEASAATTIQLIYQAEDAYFVGQGVVESNWSGYTGTGFVNVNNAVGSYIEWTVNAPLAGLYTLAIRFANGSTSARTAEIKVNGSVAIASLSFGLTGAWSTWTNANMDVTLQAGANTIRATSLLSTGGPNYDKLEIIAFPAK